MGLSFVTLGVDYMKRLIKALISFFIIICIIFSFFINASAENYTQAPISMSYYSAGGWNSFSSFGEASNITGLRLTTVDSNYYFKYRTWNAGRNDFYNSVNSNSTADSAYAGTGHLESTQRNIQCVDIDVYSTSTNTKISTGIVIMYRVKIASGWLNWVSNAAREEMQLIKNTYSLDGELDTVSAYAGKTGNDITGLDIRVFILNDNIDIPIVLAGTEQNPKLEYASNSSTLTEFNKKIENSDMISAIKISTLLNKNYYLSYSVSAEGNQGYYSAVKSNEDDYAGVYGRAIETVKIQAFDLNGNNITNGVVVLYRVYTDKWLPWVSNASAEYMNSVKLRYNISGQLDTKSGYAGVKGTRIKGIEIRVFEESEIMTDCGFSNVNTLNVPYISQVQTYPTGCESVSTVMALNFAGNNMTVDTFIDNYLDKSPFIHNFNPNECFGGDPRSTSGMGCYAPAIEKALNKFLPQTGQYLVNLTGNSLEYLCLNYIDNGVSVVVWATQGMKPAHNVSYEEGLQWIAPEHCLVLTGYDDRCYIFNDPLVGANVHYLKSDVELAFAALNSQALAIMPKLKPSTPEKPQIISNNGSKVIFEEGYEYSLDGITWQSENTFNGILNDVIYTFYRKIPATETSLESDVSEPLSYIKSSAVGYALTGATKIVVDKEEGFEYSLDNISWQSDNVFTGLEPNKEYKIFKRLINENILSFADENATTFVTNGRDSIENPTATDLAALRKLLFEETRTDLASDFTGDNRIDVIDLVRLKKIIAGILI